MEIYYCLLYLTGICCGSCVVICIICGILGIIEAIVKIFHKKPTYNHCVIKEGKK